jgi:hypothetical protein
MVYRLQIDDAIRMEIQNALNAGRTVTVHEAPITVSGWTGTGYIIDNPATGAGAYKISGGANGGMIITALATIVTLSVAFFQIVAYVTLAAPWVALVAFLGGLAINWILGMYLNDIEKVDLAANRMFGVTLIAVAFLMAGYVNFAIISVLAAALIFLYSLIDLLRDRLSMLPSLNHILSNRRKMLPEYRGFA